MSWTIVVYTETWLIYSSYKYVNWPTYLPLIEPHDNDKWFCCFAVPCHPFFAPTPMRLSPGYQHSLTLAILQMTRHPQKKLYRRVVKPFTSEWHSVTYFPDLCMSIIYKYLYMYIINLMCVCVFSLSFELGSIDMLRLNKFLGDCVCLRKCILIWPNFKISRYQYPLSTHQQQTANDAASPWVSESNADHQRPKQKAAARFSCWSTSVRPWRSCCWYYCNCIALPCHQCIALCRYWSTAMHNCCVSEQTKLDEHAKAVKHKVHLLMCSSTNVALSNKEHFALKKYYILEHKYVFSVMRTMYRLHLTQVSWFDPTMLNLRRREKEFLVGNVPVSDLDNLVWMGSQTASMVQRLNMHIAIDKYV